MSQQNNEFHEHILTSTHTESCQIRKIRTNSGISGQTGEGGRGVRFQQTMHPICEIRGSTYTGCATSQQEVAKTTRRTEWSDSTTGDEHGANLKRDFNIEKFSIASCNEDGMRSAYRCYQGLRFGGIPYSPFARTGSARHGVNRREGRVCQGQGQ